MFDIPCSDLIEWGVGPFTEGKELSVKIVIVGNGKVGFTLAEQLVKENHDITIVDTNEQALRRGTDVLDIMAVKGNGVSGSVLREAGAENADLLVAEAGKGCVIHLINVRLIKKNLPGAGSQKSAQHIQ